MPAFAGFARTEFLPGLAITAFCLGLSAGCSTSASNPDGGEGGSSGDGAPAILDICDAFTSVGDRCPLESPVRCFPECEAGGCYCARGDGGAVWACATDLSCVPDCGPLDDGCAGSD